MEVSNSAVKIPDAESETPTRIQPGKLLPLPSSTNGVLKRHAPPQLHHGHPVVVTYKECLKNHAATLGGHALDGCGEFIPALASNPADPTSLKCAACGCHRNFHRREPDDHLLANAVAPALEYRPHHRHQSPPPPIPPNSGSPDNSPSPPPISSAYYPYAPHMLLALSHGMPGPPPDSHALISASAVGGGGINTSPPLSSSSRKRFRTKFTQNQKEKMLEFAESIGWRIQRKDEDLINEFCCDVGVEKGVLKVWMHNHKNNFGKKDHQSNSPPPPATSNGGEMSHTAAEDGDSKENVQLQELRHHNDHQHDDNSNLGTSNGSSSS